MFVSNQLVYIELQKTGCTHIRNVLANYISGEMVGKHNHAEAQLFNGERIFVGSVRNPWEWYLSLWSYGCGERGGIYENVSQSRIKIRGLGWRKKPHRAVLAMLSSCVDHSKAWKQVYSDVASASAFREWLNMIHDKRYWGDIGEGYAASPMSRIVGLMTYRYVNLHCVKAGENVRVLPLKSFRDIAQYEKDHCFIDYFIRNELMEDGLLEVLKRAGILLSDAELSSLRSLPRTNASQREYGAKHYYDKDTVELVRLRDRLVVEKFGYTPPMV